MLRDEGFGDCNIQSTSLPTSKTKPYRQGEATMISTTTISAHDISILYSSGTLSHVTPTNLQYKVFFELGMHFSRRGREGLRELKHSQIVFKEDSEEKNYATLSFNPMEKNYHGLDASDANHDQRIYSTTLEKDPLSSLRCTSRN